jgi:5-methylthioadenosine/S-adenosylhomocysteine deaminase
MELLVRGRYVITSAVEGIKGILTDGAVYISDDLIAEVGSFSSLKEKYPKAQVKGNGKQLLLPGIIDGHSHGNGLTSIQKGMTYDFLENLLIDWAYLSGIDVHLNTMLSAVRHIRSGCTTMHVNYWGEEPNSLENAEKVITASRATGIRLSYSPGGRNVNALALDDEEFFKTIPLDLQEFARPMVYFNKKEFVRRYFELFDTLYSRHSGDCVRVIFGPSWAQGCTDDFLQQIKEKADSLGKTQIHLHTLQTPIQKAYGLRKYGKSLLAHLDDIGLVDENLTLGHAVFLNESDIELLADKGASTTHHPSCNLAVRNGISPVYYLIRAGVNVALGIDDKAINDDEDGIMELRLIHRLHRVSGFDLSRTPPFTAFDVLKIGTVNGARVCGFDGELGELKPGMRADMILLDLDEIMEDPWMSQRLSIAEIFIHRAKGVHVNTVIVDGKVIMEDRKIVTVDVDSLYREVRKEASKEISPEKRAFADKLQRIKPYYHKWYEGWENLEYKPFYVMNSKI